MEDHARYVNPLTARYAGAEMSHIFSDDHKFGLWRRLWLALARSEQRLGLDISDAQLQVTSAGWPSPQARLTRRPSPNKFS